MIILLIKKPINTDYSTLTENIDSNSKAPKFKVNDRVRITKYKNIFSKGYTEYWSRELLSIIEYLLSILFWKIILGHIKFYDLNGEKIIENFCEKDFLRSIL